MTTPKKPRRPCIPLRKPRARWLAKQLRFGDEPLTDTVLRALENEYARRVKRSQKK